MVTPGTEDTWAAVAAPALRRLVQNRLNQRLSRERKRQKEEAAGIARRRRGRPRTVSALAPSPADQAPTAAKPGAAESQGVPFHITAAPETLDFNSIVSSLIENLSSFVLRRLTYGDPSSDLLLHLTTLNSLRAVIYIMDMLELSINEMHDEHSISQFNSAKPALVARRRLLPPSLQPTMKQVTVTHHPWIDVFPLPSLRDSLLLQEEALATDEGGDFEDTDLCSDALGLNPQQAAGLYVWGNPWETCAWEVSEGFARKWCWLLRGYHEILTPTNYWRARRGEPALVLEE